MKRGTASTRDRTVEAPKPTSSDLCNDIENTQTNPRPGRFQDREIGTVAIAFRMYAEGRLFIKALELTQIESKHNPGFCELYRGKVGNLDVIVSINPFNQRHQVASVGTTFSALTAMNVCNEFKPDLLINAGTASGFAKNGTNIGDTFVTNGPVYYHDRRIPLPSYEQFGRGAFPTVPTTRLAKELGAQPGIFSTGNSFDMSEADAEELRINGAQVKDMETAAFAEIADYKQVPFAAIRTITDFIDGRKPTPEQFIENFNQATGRLRLALLKLVSYLANEPRRIRDL
jgi:nucleoside phosphorylase